jgi:ABC-2 type transport system ATP-binding protein
MMPTLREEMVSRVIEVEHLTKRYGEFTAVRDVSFDVKKGEILGFLGPNGAGKTTTLRILTCFMAPTEGRASVAGHDVVEDSLAVRREVGYLPESVPLYTEMTPRGYLHYCGALRGMTKAERLNRVVEVADSCRIADVLDKSIGKLSKGYRQRVGLAQALLHSPQVLILDEPTVGLDPKQIAETRKVIRSLAGEHTVILSTHILPEVAMTCDRVAIINQGRIVAEDTPERLTSSMTKSERTLVRVRGEAKLEERVSSVEGITAVRAHTEAVGEGSAFIVESKPGVDVRPAIARAIVQGGIDLLELHPMAMSLEEIFVELTTVEEAIDG